MAKVVTIIPREWQHFGRIVREEFTAAMQRAGTGFHRELGRQFELEDLNASGKTWDSIQVGKVRFVGDRATIQVGPTGDRKRIMTFIEAGREPGSAQPPLKPIIEWLTDRNIVSEGDDPKKVRAIAWYISRQIAQYGIEPRHIFAKATRRYEPRIRQIMEAAAKRVVKRINNGNNGYGQTGTDIDSFVA